MQHTTAMTTADLAFCFYKCFYNNLNYRSNVVSSITPTCFGKNHNKTHRRTCLSHEICLQNKISQTPIPVNDVVLIDNMCRIHLIQGILANFKEFSDRVSNFNHIKNIQSYCTVRVYMYIIYRYY